MTDELRDEIAETVAQAVYGAAPDFRDAESMYAAVLAADDILAIPEIAAALRQAKMIADEEPKFMFSGAHSELLARLRKAAEQP